MKRFMLAISGGIHLGNEMTIYLALVGGVPRASLEFKFLTVLKLLRPGNFKEQGQLRPLTSTHGISTGERKKE
jgi:hypothetical protein